MSSPMKLGVLLLIIINIPSYAWTPCVRRLTRTLSKSKNLRPFLAQATPDDNTTEKYGLEVGLFESLKKKDGGESAKSLLKRYGIAYLATSIPLALVSFALCYVLVDNGVDVASLLEKIGIVNNDAGEKAGTFALAYAAHKAASPIRFPPTVILTPIVAKLIGKEPQEDDIDEADSPSSKA